MLLEALVAIRNGSESIAKGSEFEAVDGVANQLIRYGLAKEVVVKRPKRTRG